MPSHHVLRRTIETVVRRAQDSPDQSQDLPALPMLIFSLTCLFFVVVFFTISYTYGQVLPTLCMVESPETSAYVPVNSLATEDQPPAYDDEGQDAAPAAEEEVNLVRNKPFTTSLRATVRHLRARAGFWSRFRGFWIYLVMGIFTNILVSIFGIGARNPIALSVILVIAQTILANFHMTWIHIVISEPSDKKWWNRLPKPAFQSWRRIAPAVALWAATTQFVYLLPMVVMGAGLDRFYEPDFHPTRKDLYLIAGQAFGAFLLTLILFFLLEIPAMVMMTRVAASMLPEEDETIVPFDRSYGGKVRPEIVGGAGKIGLLEAWKSFPWASRKRLVIMCAKVMGMVMVAYLAFTVVLVLEAHLLFGEETFVHMINAIRAMMKP